MKTEIKELLINKLDAIEELNKNSATIMIGELKETIVYITNLKKENERLKEKIEHLLIDLNGESEYKTRNDKAINCINHYATENDDYSKLYSIEEEELLEILQGKSDE